MSLFRRRAQPPRRPKLRDPMRVPGSYQLADVDLEAAVNIASMGGDTRGGDVYEPRDHQRFWKPGAWAMIVSDLPSIEGGINKHVTPGRAFWLEHDASADEAGFTPDGSYLVLCRTIWGEVKLWPYEYMIISPERLVDCWARGEMVFHASRQSEKQTSDVMFYCQSRGIGREDAMVMALGTLSGPIGWFEPSPALSEELPEIARSFGRIGRITSVNHERRAEARRRHQEEERKRGKKGSMRYKTGDHFGTWVYLERLGHLVVGGKGNRFSYRYACTSCGLERTTRKGPGEMSTVGCSTCKREARAHGG